MVKLARKNSDEVEFNFEQSLSRLKDDQNVLKDRPELLKKAREMMSQAVTRMCMKLERGGNPFAFIIMSDKTHYVRDQMDGHEFRTAATDSIAYYWSPDLLEALVEQPLQNVMSIMKHEVYHNVLYHTLEERRAGRRKDVWAIVVDWMANGSVAKECEKWEKLDRNKLWQIQMPWPKETKRRVKDEDGNMVDIIVSEKRDEAGKLHLKMSTPCSIDMYVDFLRAKRDTVPEPLVWYDAKAIDYTLDDLYDLIIKEMQNSPRRCKEKDGGCGAMSMDPKTGKSKIPKPWEPHACKKCGAVPAPDGFGTDTPKGAFDEHIASKKSKQETIEETMRAAESAEAISRGSTPGCIKDVLGDLDDPELSPKDLIVNALHRRVLDEGANNDWTRFRRRPTYLFKKDAEGRLKKGSRIYVPKYFDHAPLWVAAVDTSGSMSDEDIRYGVKELKICANQTSSEGWMVPLDAKPYWDAAKRVENVDDMKRFETVGRGGTVFFEFFRDLHDHYDEIDLVAVVTDGYIDQIPTAYAPRCDVVWIITSGYDEFVPPFGRKCTLRSRRRGF